MATSSSSSGKSGRNSGRSDARSGGSAGTRSDARSGGNRSKAPRGKIRPEPPFTFDNVIDDYLAYLQAAVWSEIFMLTLVMHSDHLAAMDALADEKTDPDDRIVLMLHDFFGTLCLNEEFFHRNLRPEFPRGLLESDFVADEAYKPWLELSSLLEAVLETDGPQSREAFRPFNLDAGALLDTIAADTSRILQESFGTDYAQAAACLAGLHAHDDFLEHHFPEGQEVTPYTAFLLDLTAGFLADPERRPGSTLTNLLHELPKEELEAAAAAFGDSPCSPDEDDRIFLQMLDDYIRFWDIIAAARDKETDVLVKILQAMGDRLGPLFNQLGSAVHDYSALNPDYGKKLGALFRERETQLTERMLDCLAEDEDDERAWNINIFNHKCIFESLLEKESNISPHFRRCVEAAAARLQQIEDEAEAADGGEE